MGKHGGGGRSRRRVGRISTLTLAIGVLVVAAIGFGVWLFSIRSVSDPIDANPVNAYAVVVSSPSCTSGSGSTVIDLNLTPVVRSSLSACGRRVGEQLAVQYLEGHPNESRLAGTTVAHQGKFGLWLPIVIVAAGLLALIGIISLLVERRQAKHGDAGSRITVAQLLSDRPTGRAVSTALVAASARVPAPEVGGAEIPARTWSSADSNPDVTSRIAALGFPGAVERSFRPSEIAVQDDLFTHRGPQAPDS